MLKSMTAYGRASLSTAEGQYSVEIQTVNRRHLEVSLFLPDALTRFESDVRELISKRIQRGQVTVKLSAYFEETSLITVKPNLPFVRQLKHAWDAILQETGTKQEFSPNLLVKEEGILLYEKDIHNEDEYRNAIIAVIKEALDRLVEMREREGKTLEQDLAKRIQLLKKVIEEIALLAPNATTKYRQKLRERMEEISGGKLTDERLMTEVALFAERVDISEEVVRFRSHLMQCEQLLFSIEPAGKTFEFLLQELNREINTIGSKASDREVTQLVIAAKTEIERLREQVQNVE